MNKTYKGIRTNGIAQVFVLDGQGGRLLALEPSLAVANHSPTGFEWGYFGSGPSQLALALLLDATGNDVFARDNHQHFKSEVVAAFADGWTFTVGQVLEWTAAHAKMEVGL